MNDTFFVHFRRRFDLIGFDTSHIMRLFRGQNVHQFIHGIFENGSGRLGSFGGFGDVYRECKENSFSYAVNDR